MVICFGAQKEKLYSCEMCEFDCITDRLKCNERKSIRHFRDIQESLKRKPLPFFTKSEVVVHNSPDDCWVSFLGIVRNLTALVAEYEGEPEIRPIVAFAGKDISDWFEPRTGDILHHVHPITGVRVPYLPHGPLPDVLPQVPTSEWSPLDHTPWWLDPAYVVGYVSTNTRPIRVMNVLTKEETVVEVCSEDSLERILERYFMFNSHSNSYTWKFEGRVLDMSMTLDENKISDPRARLRSVNLPDDTYVPCLMLYFNDDLT